MADDLEESGKMEKNVPTVQPWKLAASLREGEAM